MQFFKQAGQRLRSQYAVKFLSASPKPVLEVVCFVVDVFFAGKLIKGGQSSGGKGKIRTKKPNP